MKTNISSEALVEVVLTEFLVQGHLDSRWERVFESALKMLVGWLWYGQAGTCGKERIQGWWWWR
jgi:hypothetical protein